MAHGVCQAVLLILNLPMIAFGMWLSFDARVLPRFSRHFGKRHYAIAMIHGALGALAEVLGLYILVFGIRIIRTGLDEGANFVDNWGYES